ncbi:DUF397 domain-containing protein [Streptomyces specialis]|uniref:DUF397 domain-containing protein n=1 Tax=Streptomyces specialis TaxID=498367 RepID=UPI00073EBFD7|nr:DUF397 domain-containing protein [Streptomyces specialis]
MGKSGKTPVGRSFDWRTSSYTAGSGQCVEVASGGSIVLVRDTKDRGRAYTRTSAEAWMAFLPVLKAGKF